MENNSVDLIKCSISAEGINGSHSASVEMDLDKPNFCTKSAELQVFRQWGQYAFQNGKDFRDCNGFSPGHHVGAMSVTTISDDTKCQKQRNNINVIVKSYTQRPAREICVKRDIKVCAFKQKIYEKLFRVVPSQQRLVYKGHNLEDDKTLAYYGIQNNECVELTGRLRGG